MSVIKNKFENPTQNQLMYIVTILHHQSHFHESSSSIIILGLYNNKVDAYKQAILYEYDNNKQFVRPNSSVNSSISSNGSSEDLNALDKFEKEYKEVLRELNQINNEENNENLDKIIKKWITIREFYLGTSIYGKTSGYRHYVEEINEVY